jgi:hypothetical protein
MEMKICRNCKHDQKGLGRNGFAKCYDAIGKCVEADKWEAKEKPMSKIEFESDRMKDIEIDTKYFQLDLWKNELSQLSCGISLTWFPISLYVNLAIYKYHISIEIGK